MVVEDVQQEAKKADEDGHNEIHARQYTAPRCRGIGSLLLVI